jgi:predicted alpha/beta hydrolase
MATPLRISATDGYALGARRYGECGAGPYVVINGATAVPQSFYARFATWLSLQGMTVVTYDYRGIGDSRPARMRGFHATMRDWGEKDFEGVLRFALSEKGERPVVVIGHSVGGQLLGLAQSNGAVARAVTVGAQSGYWGHWDGWSKAHKMAVWYAVIPAVTHVVGYFPRQFGLGEDLPQGVALEWARWCRHPRYVFSRPDTAAGFARVQAPIKSFSVDDDDYAPERAVDWLHRAFTGAPVERVHLVARDLHASGVGHFGFFRPVFQDSLWSQVSRFVAKGRSSPTGAARQPVA